MAEKWKRKNPGGMVLAVVFLGYLLFNGILLARHELWRDEANVWLMAKELSPIGLFREIKYQGHPCLWYLLLMPFAKAGLPFGTICVASYCIMAVSAGLFLFKAPFCVPVKAILVFSPVFTYYYPVVARNYCLIALLLILLALAYPKRNEKCFLYGLLLGLLVQSDVIALAAAGMISAMWLCENLLSCFKEKKWAPFKNILRGIWIPLFSLILLIAQFFQISDSPVFQMKSFGAGEFLTEVKNYSYWILERLTGRGQTFCLVMLLLVLGCLLAVSFQVKNFWAAGVMAAAYLFQSVFSVVVYQLHIWHFISLGFVLVWAVWVLNCQKEEKQVLGKAPGAVLLGVQGLAAVMAVCMFLQWNSEDEASGLANALKGLYSDGVHTAEFIEENIPKDALMVSVNVPFASTVKAYLPNRRFYFAGNGQIETYADWGESQSGQISLDELVLWARSSFPEKNEFYLLDSAGSCLTNTEGLSEGEILYQTGQETARGEEYTVYRIPLG